MIRFTFLICLLSQQVLAFVVPYNQQQHNARIVVSKVCLPPIFATTTTTTTGEEYEVDNHNHQEEEEEEIGLVDVLQKNKERRFGIVSSVFSRIKGSFTGIVTGLSCFVARGMAADDYEIAELPPPYVPALFGVVLLVGVGLLTSSLGNVMDEGKQIKELLL